MVEMTPERIRFLRKRLGLSQAQLGQMLNVHQTLISHWENDFRVPDEYQEEQLRHLYRSAQELDENKQKKLDELFAKGLVAGALAFLITVGIGLLTDDDL
jgi:transcriptional regulator with XRE-family HTH domain